MKEKYIKPTVKTEVFKTVDVITTSGGNDDLRDDDNVVNGSDGWD